MCQQSYMAHRRSTWHIEEGTSREGIARDRYVLSSEGIGLAIGGLEGLDLIPRASELQHDSCTRRLIEER